MKQRRQNQKGQAAIETGLALTFIIWLLYYTVNGFHAVHTAHIGQKYSSMNLYQRLENQAKFVVDREASELHGQEFMGVQYMNEDGTIPQRRILLDGTTRPQIDTKIGICLEPAGSCAP